MSEQFWTPFESNPEVMNKFLSNIGVPNEWSVVDVIGLDEELLQFMESPVLSLILLVPTVLLSSWDKHSEETDRETKVDDKANDVFFMRQTIHNACGTIALIHSVANNCDRIQLRADSALKTFIDNSKNESPEERGKQLEANEDICNAHQNIAPEGQTSAQDSDPSEYHFVALVQKNGFVYELDGRKDKPTKHGKTSEQTFLSDAAMVCRKYMARDPNNLNFSVIALSHQT